MEKVLLMGNYSVVFGWLFELLENDCIRLCMVVKLGNVYGFVMCFLNEIKFD